MQFRNYCFLIIFVLISTSAWAGVGMVETSFTDSLRGRKLDTHIWYPCDDGSPERLAENPVFEGFDAVLDGKIKSGKYPLYVLLHGTTGNWRNLSWLAARIASDGAIVVAANHPGYTSGNATPSSVIRAWEQPRDATFLLGEMLESRFNDYVDRDRIYAIGYSLGGYSALALAGARLDMHRYIEFCGSNEDVSCRYFKPAFSSLSDADFKNAAMDLKDERFTGIIALAPGFVESVTQESLSRIMVPTLIVGASLDKNVPPATHLLPWRENFSELMRYEEIPDAAHFSFMQICKPNGAAILAEEGAEFVCQDGNGSSRRDIHETLYKLIVDFLRPTTN